MDRPGDDEADLLLDDEDEEPGEFDFAGQEIKQRKDKKQVDKKDAEAKHKKVQRDPRFVLQLPVYIRRNHFNLMRTASHTG